MSAVGRGYTIDCFDVVFHLLMYLGMEGEVVFRTANSLEGDVGGGFYQAVVTARCIFVCDGGGSTSHVKVILNLGVENGGGDGL